MGNRCLRSLCCQENAGRFPNNVEINFIIQIHLCKHNIPSILESTGLDRTDGKRLDGITTVFLGDMIHAWSAIQLR